MSASIFSSAHEHVAHPEGVALAEKFAIEDSPHLGSISWRADGFNRLGQGNNGIGELNDFFPAMSIMYDRFHGLNQHTDSYLALSKT
jgi:hypothetical protein